MKLAEKIIQPRLTINTPGDKYAQEADAMADKIMYMSAKETTKPVTGLIGKSLQRKCAHCEEEEKRIPIMRKEAGGNGGMPVSSSFSSSLNSTKGTGAILPQGTRAFMENAFNIDFSGVRIHTDSQANILSQIINAKAFTLGNDIYFDEGQYAPNSDSGKSLLAHELTHTIQQECEKNIQRTVDHESNTPDSYRIAMEAANYFLQYGLNSMDKIKVVEDCNKNSKAENRCTAKSYGGIIAKIIWWQIPNYVKLEINTCRSSENRKNIFCTYTYRRDSKGYIFKEKNCDELACI